MFLNHVSSLMLHSVINYFGFKKINEKINEKIKDGIEILIVVAVQQVV